MGSSRRFASERRGVAVAGVAKCSNPDLGTTVQAWETNARRPSDAALKRIPLMYNDFVIVGPSADPAGAHAQPSAIEALRAIASKSASFVSRGDGSGTHVAELELWKKAGVKPAGPWYVVYEKGSEGNAATLRYAEQRQAYTVIDRATWLSMKDGARLAVLLEKD